MSTKLLDIVKDLALSWWASKGNSIDNLSEDEINNIILQHTQESKLKVRIKFTK